MNKMYKIRILLLGIVILLSFSSNAQKQPNSCRTSEVMQELYKKRPASYEQAKSLNDFTKKYGSLKSTKAVGGYTIPVVFHVYGTNFNGATVTDAIIIDALQKTNEDFQGLTADWNDIIPEFDGVKKALDITFKLAQIDPDGNATTGIVYYGDAAGYGNGGGYDSQIQQDAWDNYKYMNVYIQNDLYDDGATTNSGVAWYPDTWMSDNNLARVVYNGAYLGTNTDENFRSVLTHEFGHFLNLIHTFEGGCPDAVDCSTSGDQICDTPPADNSSMNGALNCQGVVTNWENFMDYSNNYSMFTVDQITRVEAALQHATRSPLWQATNLDATGVNGNLGPRLLISSNMFREAYQNNGAVESTQTISAVDGAKFATTGNLTEGTHFTVSNVPQGLTVNVSVTNDTIAIVSFQGNAVLHDNANDVSGISILILDPAIVGGVSTLFSNSINNLSIDFIDPYKVIFEDIADIAVDSINTWTYFALPNGKEFGAWYENGKLRLETYTKPMVSEGTSRNISLIPFNQEINSSSNWVVGGAYPDEHDLRSDTYTVWDGQTGYMAFQFSTNGHPCYGWFKVKVSTTGDSYTLMEYAYNEEPYAPIIAGKSLGLRLGISSKVFAEAYQNNGAIENTETITAYDGAEFALTGNLTQGTHYTASNVPAGLSLNISVNNATSATVSLTGTAGSHLNTDDVANMAITLLDPAIVGGVSSLLSASIDSISIDFIDPYQLVYEDIADISVDTVNTWTYFTIQNGNDFGIWYEAGKLRFETYKRPMACEGTSRNISLIPFDQEINSTSNWVASGDYPDEHDLRTATYTVWDGQTAYMGFQFDTKGHPSYGWFKVQVSAAGDSYTLMEYAYNEEPYIPIKAGNTVGGSTDTQAPTQPTNLIASNITETGLDLSWTASTDNVAVSGYDIYQDNSLVQSVTGISTVVTGLTASTNYTFSVKAKDAAGNVSIASSTLNLTTAAPADDGGALSEGVASTGSMDATDGSDMWFVEVGPNAKTLRVVLETGSSDFDTYGKFSAEPTTTTYDWRGYTSGGEDNTVNSPQEGRHYIMVKYYSGSGNYTLTASVSYNLPDTEAPTAPTNLIGSNITETGLDLTWAASSDNVAVTAYELYQNGSVVQTVTTTNAVVSGLTAGTSYSFSVKAKDAAGNVSAASNILDVITPLVTVTYCTVSHDRPLDYFYIQNVSFGSIDNSSILGNIYTGYSDYTAQSTTVNRGSTYNLSVNWTPAWGSNSAKVYIDWNQDGDFDDLGETVMDVLGANIPYATSVTVPSDAVAGNTRMRVRLTYSKAINPCGNLYWGETEDYSINVSASAAGQVLSAPQESGLKVQVYPNPATDILVVELLNSENGTISLLNLNGQTVKEITINNKHQEIDISMLQKGMYFVKIISADKTVLSKVIIQ